MFVQRCLTEIGKQTVQAIQRHGRWRRDFHADRLSVLGVVDHEQATGGFLSFWRCRYAEKALLFVGGALLFFCCIVTPRKA